MWERALACSCVMLRVSFTEVRASRQQQPPSCFQCFLNFPGQIVDARYCDVTRKPNDTRACLTPCPSDCELSDWSDWTSCDVTCGDAYKHRFRWIIKQSQHGGERCPPASDDGPPSLQTLLLFLHVYLYFCVVTCIFSSSQASSFKAVNVGAAIRARTIFGT